MQLSDKRGRRLFIYEKEVGVEPRQQTRLVVGCLKEAAKLNWTG